MISVINSCHSSIHDTHTKILHNIILNVKYALRALLNVVSQPYFKHNFLIKKCILSASISKSLKL